MFSQSLRPWGPGTDYKNPWIPKIRKITKKIQNPPSGLGPENTKKLPKKYKVIFSFLGPQPGKGDFVFFRNFFVFSGFRGFCNLYQAPRVTTQSTVSNTELSDQEQTKGRFCKRVALVNVPCSGSWGSGISNHTLLLLGRHCREDFLEEILVQGNVCPNHPS